MLLQVVQSVTFFNLLHQIDVEFTWESRQKGCPHCGGSLHQANYKRKPRGGPVGLPEKYSIRFSLCCAREGCRGRTNPPSCLFMGRKVYWSAIILIATTLRQQRMQSASARQLKKLFGVTHQTLLRWNRFFQNHFPQSPWWQKLRGSISAVVEDTNLPQALVLFFIDSHHNPQDGLVALLKFFAYPSL
jgi:hypothetical protein